MFNSKYLSLSALGIALTASVGWGSYMTSFEAAQGFTAGSSPGSVDSWTSASTTVTNSTASDGSQSIWIASNSGTAGITRTFTTAEATAADNLLSFDFKPEAGSAAGARIAWLYANVNNTGSSGDKFYLYNGTTTVQPYIWWHGDTKVYVPNGTWTDGAWNTLQVKFDSTHQTFDIAINGNSVAMGLAGAGTGATRYSEFEAFESGNGSDPRGLYIDNVRVTPAPEPAMLSLLGLGGMGMLMRRKRSK